MRILNVFVHFRRNQDGAISILAVYLMASITVIAGLAVDVSNLVAQRTKLQMTADLAAHAALYTRDSASADTAKQAALAVIEESMPAERYGEVIGMEDIIFGDYDPATGQFLADDGSRNAVLVNATRFAEKNNPVTSFLMQFVGIPEWDVATQAVFVTFRPACLREGFVAEDVVDLRSNNGFSNGFCIHSNAHVSLNQNNFFEDGTIVSMPDLDDLDIPRSGFEKNEGLELALREGRMHIRVLNQIDQIADGLFAFGSDYMPDYITSPNVNYHYGKRFTAADFLPGTINYLPCSNTATLYDTDGAFSQIVLIAECEIKFANGVILEDARILSFATSLDAISSVSGMQIGRDDSCAPGGGVQIISYGGMRFPASLQIYGSQLIALRSIQFSANADGVEGASLISGEWIEGTSNMDMAFCGTGMEDNFEAEYFRLAL